jgi:hypothetical protein
LSYKFRRIIPASALSLVERAARGKSPKENQMKKDQKNGRGDSAAHNCINCGEDVRPDGVAEGHAMFIDAEGNRTCETLGGGENAPAHFVNPEQMPQGDSALQDLFFEAVKIAGAAIALADDYSGGESETAQHLAKEYDKLNIKFDLLKS